MAADRKDYILVVDDTNFMRLLLGKILNGYGHNVKTVPSGFEALREIEKHTPKLIFLDLNLPGDHGTEVCAAIRKLEGCDATPIVVCSAVQTREMVQRSKHAGASDFLCKPVDRFNVGERLVKHLGEGAAPGYIPRAASGPVSKRVARRSHDDPVHAAGPGQEADDVSDMPATDNKENHELAAHETVEQERTTETPNAPESQEKPND